MKYKVTFAEEDVSVLAEEGSTLFEAQIQAGLTPDAYCGGKGKCGKCKVVIDGKEVLACQTAVHGDVTVYTGHKKEEAQILVSGTGKRISFAPGELPGELKEPLLGAV